MITWALGATAALLSLQTPRRPFGKQGSVCYITWLCHKLSAWVLGPVCVHRLCPLVHRWPRTSLHCAHSSLSVSALVMGTWQLVGFLFLFLKRGNVITALKIDIHMSLFQRSLNTCKGEVALGLCSTPNTPHHCHQWQVRDLRTCFFISLLYCISVSSSPDPNAYYI